MAVHRRYFPEQPAAQAEDRCTERESSGLQEAASHPCHMLKFKQALSLSGQPAIRIINHILLSTIWK